MADLTNVLKAKAVAFDERQPLEWHKRSINLADLTGGGSDDLLKVLVSGGISLATLAALYFVVRVNGAGGTSLQFTFNGEDLFAAPVVTANLANGKLHQADLNNKELSVSADSNIGVTTVGTFSAGTIDLYAGVLRSTD